MEQQKSYGAVVASIIIILVLIVGALYFWGKTLEKTGQSQPQQQSAAQVEQATTTQENDSVDSIKADLNQTQDLKDIDAGLKEI